MPYSSYTSLSGLSLGDTEFTLEKDVVTSSYIDFNLKAYGCKFQKIDIAFEYRFNEQESWRTDAFIIGSQTSYIQQNKLLGVTVSNQGTDNTFRWKYISNNVLEGMAIELRVRLLPRTTNYSYYSGSTVISDAYGESFFDVEGVINKRCIGKDYYGRYLCVDSTTFYIYESLTATSPVYSYSGLSNPIYAKHLRNGNYIIAGSSSNTIEELDGTLSTVIKSLAVTTPAYFDFSEQNETLLVVANGSSSLYEVTWSTMDYGTTIWTSGTIFNQLRCANYNERNFNDVVAVDKYSVYTLDRQKNTYIRLDEYKYKNGGGVKYFWNPHRAFFYNNETICVVEQNGEIITFDDLYSSSSSSSSS